MCDKTNMTHVDFNKFITSNGFDEADEEDICHALIDCLSKE